MDQYTVRKSPRFDLAGVQMIQTVTLGQAWTFSLPPTFHPSGLEVFYFKVELASANYFVDYDEEQRQLTIKAGATKQDFIGEHKIKL